MIPIESIFFVSSNVVIPDALIFLTRMSLNVDIPLTLRVWACTKSVFATPVIPEPSPTNALAVTTPVKLPCLLRKSQKLQ